MPPGVCATCRALQCRCGLAIAAGLDAALLVALSEGELLSQAEEAVGAAAVPIGAGVGVGVGAAKCSNLLGAGAACRAAGAT